MLSNSYKTEKNKQNQFTAIIQSATFLKIMKLPTIPLSKKKLKKKFFIAGAVTVII